MRGSGKGLNSRYGGHWKLEKVFFNESVSTILQLVVALKLSKQQILNKIAQWISEGSGWVIQSGNSHHLNVVRYQPLKGSSYNKLPKELQNPKKGLINLQNQDDECFRWCHMLTKNVSQLNYDKINFPVKLNQVNKIEKQKSISINIFGYENKQPFPVYISKEKNYNHMDLLLITEETKSHYVLIKDFNKFMFNQTKQ